MEYIAIVARGVFDLLQEAISLMWNGRVRLLDNDAEMRRKGRGLSRHFSKLVLTKTESQRTAEDISVRFGLPPTLAAEYARHAPFSCELLNVRNRVVHGLGSKPTVFTTEKGFCVNPKAPPFKGFEGWSEQHRYNQNLVSLLPWLSHVILHTIDACSQLMSAFASQIQFPPEIAPGYRVFVRSEHNEGVIELLKCRSGELVWWEDSTPASPSSEGLPLRAPLVERRNQEDDAA